ncbi:hypothetical protein B0H16DRAFT_1894950 [Mycena metata]|uniref:Uncharacterized protein n=1 Tax=Mycena metata TaxID=1033252 RepID=A0AAD7MNR6_9AGAR|nr:hypothetical protein B0H16DRAFT_1894950 [Mycena metata]
MPGGLTEEQQVELDIRFLTSALSGRSLFVLPQRPPRPHADSDRKAQIRAFTHLANLLNLGTESCPVVAVTGTVEKERVSVLVAASSNAEHESSDVKPELVPEIEEPAATFTRQKTTSRLEGRSYSRLCNKVRRVKPQLVKRTTKGDELETEVNSSTAAAPGKALMVSLVAASPEDYPKPPFHLSLSQLEDAADWMVILCFILASKAIGKVFLAHFFTAGFIPTSFRPHSEADAEEAADDVANDNEASSSGQNLLRQLRTLGTWLEAINYFSAQRLKPFMSNISMQIALVGSPVRNEEQFCGVGDLIRTHTEQKLQASPNGLDNVSANMKKLEAELVHPADNSQVHCEASIMALMLNQGQCIAPNVTAWPIGVNKKCCWCCWQLAHFLRQDVKGMDFALSGTHRVVFGWAPPNGIPIGILKKIRGELQNNYTEICLSAQKALRSERTSPGSATVKMTVWSTMPRLIHPVSISLDHSHTQPLTQRYSSLLPARTPPPPQCLSSPSIPPESRLLCAPFPYSCCEYIPFRPTFRLPASPRPVPRMHPRAAAVRTYKPQTTMRSQRRVPNANAPPIAPFQSTTSSCDELQENTNGIPLPAESALPRVRPPCPDSSPSPPHAGKSNRASAERRYAHAEHDRGQAVPCVHLHVPSPALIFAASSLFVLTAPRVRTGVIYAYGRAESSRTRTRPKCDLPVPACLRAGNTGKDTPHHTASRLVDSGTIPNIIHHAQLCRPGKNLIAREAHLWLLAKGFAILEVSCAPSWQLGGESSDLFVPARDSRTTDHFGNHAIEEGKACSLPS